MCEYITLVCEINTEVFESTGEMNLRANMEREIKRGNMESKKTKAGGVIQLVRRSQFHHCDYRHLMTLQRASICPSSCRSLNCIPSSGHRASFGNNKVFDELNGPLSETF